MSKSLEIKLKVEEAKGRDVGRFIARIPQRVMRMLGISAGDYIEIVGKSSAPGALRGREQGHNQA